MANPNYRRIPVSDLNHSKEISQSMQIILNDRQDSMGYFEVASWIDNCSTLSPEDKNKAKEILNQMPKEAYDKIWTTIKKAAGAVYNFVYSMLYEDKSISEDKIISFQEDSKNNIIVTQNNENKQKLSSNMEQLKKLMKDEDKFLEDNSEEFFEKNHLIPNENSKPVFVLRAMPQGQNEGQNPERAEEHPDFQKDLSEGKAKAFDTVYVIKSFTSFHETQGMKAIDKIYRTVAQHNEVRKNFEEQFESLQKRSQRMFAFQKQDFNKAEGEFKILEKSDFFY
ncbi:MAG: hypothetical protein MJ252_02750 [archaeon]|nr:hypothetical protein [archaeon]